MQIDNMLQEWMKLKKELDSIKEREMTLRKAIFALAFPSPIEGTNKAPLGAGWILQGNYPIERKLDEAALEAIQSRFFDFKMPPDIVKTKLELNLKPYRTLTEEQLKFFDQCLIIKPGSPSLKVVPPKED